MAWVGFIATFFVIAGFILGVLFSDFDDDDNDYLNKV